MIVLVLVGVVVLVLVCDGSAVSVGSSVGLGEAVRVGSGVSVPVGELVGRVSRLAESAGKVSATFDLVSAVGEPEHPKSDTARIRRIAPSKGIGFSFSPP